MTAPQSDTRRGYVKGQPLRFRVGHEARLRPKLRDTWWALVDRSNGPDACWLWTGATDLNGYGKIPGEKKGHRLGVHRLAWERENGPIPDGLWVLHHCDTPPCCNPRHLFLGTNADNIRDMNRKGRAGSQTNRDRYLGDRNPAAKLTEEQRSEIRRRYAAGGVLQRELAAEYGVTQVTVSNILLGPRRRDPRDRNTRRRERFQ